MFSAANGNQISVSDPDGPGPFEVELNSTNGAAAVTAAGGVTLTGNGTSTVQIIGSLADVNDTLAVITIPGRDPGISAGDPACFPPSSS